MDSGVAISLLQQAAVTTLVLAAPPLAFALVSGLTITILEAITGIQDATLSFVPKIVAVGASLFIFGDYQLRYLVSFAQVIFTSLNTIGAS